MEIRFLGHAAFVLTTDTGMRIIIDPFQNRRGGPRWFKHRFPPMRAQLLAVTHDHFDHNAVRALRGIPSVLRQRSSIRMMDLALKLTPDRHAGDESVVNHIVTLESNGVAVCHLGLNRAKPDDEAFREVGRVDLLFVPVDDSESRLTFDQVARLIDRFDPRIVVPMHYAVEGLTIEESGLGGIDRWLESLGPDIPVSRKPSSVRVSREDLAGIAERQVWVMDAALV